MKPGLRGASFRPEVYEDLERIRRTRGYRSIAETIGELAKEALQEQNVQPTGKANANTTSALKIKDGPGQTRTGDLLGVNETSQNNPSVLLHQGDTFIRVGRFYQ